MNATHQTANLVPLNSSYRHLVGETILWQAARAIFGILLLAASGVRLAAQSDPANLQNGLVLHQTGPVSSNSITDQQLSCLSAADFTLSMWIQPNDLSSDAGDLLNWYGAANSFSGHLTLKTNTGVTSCQPNWRHLQFGIDDRSPARWEDCGVPGKALLVFAMAIHEGHLYAGTCEPAAGQQGHVYRYAGGQRWVDCGTLDQSNSVTSLAVYQGQLYAGTGKYRVAGSSLPESENQELGGRVFRYLGNNRWESTGQLPGAEAVGGIVVYRDQLYASSLYKPAGFYRLDAGGWTALNVPQLVNDNTDQQAPQRVVSLAVHGDYLYAGSYDGGRVYRYDDKQWFDCGQVGENTQTYGFINYHGNLLVSTWPSGRVYRLQADQTWSDMGRLGEELEVMAMMVHNGRLLAGTLPSGQVYTHRTGQEWELTKTLDETPNVKYRRVWTMAEFDGKLFCSTLPSGKVFACQHGLQATFDHSWPSGWHHLIAMKQSENLRLFMDGKQIVQRSGKLNQATVASRNELKIGHGIHGAFAGNIQDLRIYDRLLSDAEIQQLANSKPR